MKAPINKHVTTLSPKLWTPENEDKSYIQHNIHYIILMRRIKFNLKFEKKRVRSFRIFPQNFNKQTDIRNRAILYAQSARQTGG